MVFGEFIEEKTQSAQGGDIHKMGVVDDGHKYFPLGVEGEGLLDEAFFALEAVADEFDGEGMAEHFDGVDGGVKRSADGDDNGAFVGVLSDGVLDDGFAGAGLSHDKAEPALLGVDGQDVANFLLEGHKGNGIEDEGILRNTKK